MATTLTLVDMATQNGGTAGQYFAHIFENNRSNPSSVLQHELNPMCSKYMDHDIFQPDAL